MTKDFGVKITSFMEERSVRGERHVFRDSCRSVQEAARVAKADPLDFIKSIVLIPGTGKPIVGIVKGEDRVSTKRVAGILDLEERPRIAKPEEVLERTGYPVGGVPPFGFDAEFLVDPRVMEKEQIWSGGGSDRSLIRMPSQEILRASGGRVARIRK
jgi:prolyl-tRNA editing enzyme YbaK/EbsC (Cys-tRNA(Pro) deacylase)